MSILRVFCCGSCSASCAYPTMGDLRALATAAHEGSGIPLFNQYSSMAVRQSSGSWLLFVLIALSVPTEIPSLRPMLNHFTLASHTASRTSPRLSMVSPPAKKIQSSNHCKNNTVLITSRVPIHKKISQPMR